MNDQPYMITFITAGRAENYPVPQPASAGEDNTVGEHSKPTSFPFPVPRQRDRITTALNTIHTPNKTPTEDAEAVMMTTSLLPPLSLRESRDGGTMYEYTGIILDCQGTIGDPTEPKGSNLLSHVLYDV